MPVRWCPVEDGGAVQDGLVQDWTKPWIKDRAYSPTNPLLRTGMVIRGLVARLWQNKEDPEEDHPLLKKTTAGNRTSRLC